jgi:hypothetical protein
MRHMTKSEQRIYAKQRAPELAKSGKFLSWWEIEYYLRFDEACPEARFALDDGTIREKLNDLCRAARADA